MKTLSFTGFVLGCLTVLLTTLQQTGAQEVGFVNGINFTHPLQLSLEEQNASLSQLKAAGVKVIRVGFYAIDLDKEIDFIERADAQGIKLLLTFHCVYPADAPATAFGMYTAAVG